MKGAFFIQQPDWERRRKLLSPSTGQQK